MKLVLLSLLVAVACGITFENAEPTMESFQAYMAHYGKTYQGVEQLNRFENFKSSLQRIEERNSEQDETVFGLTKFSDMSPQEFSARYLKYERKDRSSEFTVLRTPHNVKAAANVDWRTKKAITPVKDQGQCGSCWAFSATEEIESMWFLKNGTLPVLAPQQIVSCDTVDQACDGGDTVTAYAYVKKAKGLVPERDDPYTSGNSGNRGRCKFNAKDVIAPVSGFVYATAPCESGSCNNQDQNKVEAALTSVGPISICVYAESWQDYNSGVLRSNCPHDANSLDHCVQLVGMASDYWIIRNSWASDWGEDGYIRVAKAKNLCGVLDETTIVKF
jgi:hypothetical protein